jgi:hypothetical protein
MLVATQEHITTDEPEMRLARLRRGNLEVLRGADELPDLSTQSQLRVPHY